MLDAQQYSAAHVMYERNPAGYRRPEENPSCSQSVVLTSVEAKLLHATAKDLNRHKPFLEILRSAPLKRGSE